MKEKKFPNSRKPSDRWVCGEFWNPRGQHSWEENKQTNKQNKHIEYTPNCNSHQGSSPEAHVHHQGAGSGQRGCMLRVRTRPECPEDNLRELM